MSTGDWTERFQGTRALPRGVRDRLLKVAQIRNYPKGQEVFGPRNIPDTLIVSCSSSAKCALLAR